MNAPLIIRRNVQLHQKPKASNGSPECTSITEPQPAQRIPRIARLLALALHYEQLLQQGVVRDYAQLARREQVSRARITQIMNLRLLAPDIQEALLFLPATRSGPDPLSERDLRPIVAQADWAEQRRLWAKLQRRLPRDDDELAG